MPPAPSGPARNDPSVSDPRSRAEEILGHAVPTALEADAAGRVAAASAVPDPPRSRLAWVDPGAGVIVARVACPPGVPSRWRPVVATEVLLDMPGAAPDRVLIARAAPGVASVRALLGWEGARPEAAAGEEGLAVLRLPLEVPLDGAEALDARGEPLGLLTHVGIAALRTDGRTVSGHLGAGHGMGAGIGHGRWVADLEAAAWEAGFTPLLPAFVPRGLAMGRPRIEPELAYPAAPPAVIVAWTGEDGARLLLRQAVAPLASPDPGGAHAHPVDVNGVVGAMRGRGLATLVWQTGERAFGVQVRGMEDAVAIARDVARSIPSA